MNEILNLTYGEWYEIHKNEIPKDMNPFYIWLSIIAAIKVKNV